MPDKPNIVFLGADAICLPLLEYLWSVSGAECELRAVVTQPDRPRGRGGRMGPNPVAAWAMERDLTLLKPEKPGPELAQRLAAWETRVGIVMAYGHLLSKALREAPVHGMVNFHASLLPKYRGPSPVEAAIAEGEKETGVCLMRVARAMDAGGVADYESVRIEYKDTSAALRSKIAAACVPLLRRNFNDLLEGRLNFHEQEEGAATYCRKIRKEDGWIDFNQPAEVIRNRVRAFTPWPGAFFEWNGERVKAGDARVEAGETAVEAPGTVVASKGELKVATTAGLIVFEALQRPGGRMLPAADFLRGRAIPVGAVLESRPAESLVRSRP
ncbi:MAG: methionyl-tRNA formyltransferase [Opitutales bacterium]